MYSSDVESGGKKKKKRTRRRGVLTYTSFQDGSEVLATRRWCLDPFDQACTVLGCSLGAEWQGPGSEGRAAPVLHNKLHYCNAREATVHSTGGKGGARGGYNEERGGVGCNNGRTTGCEYAAT
ncbi:hypothetical protein BCV70DRAFT_80704 [Testicularia cyperi]|uniref:Uncharacterized protein n=1 Tax=Testicularia cyperi TaxID=1882483 RepID=A0A317XIP1_9BASI|nr:hypothetical protein BCV70DRAFT_80704 [Testicularia cyperi]